MKRIAALLVFLTLLLCLCACRQEPAGTNMYFIYDDAGAFTVPMEKVEAVSADGKAAWVLGERAGNPVLLHFPDASKETYTVIELPEASFRDVSADGDKAVLLSVSGQTATVWLVAGETAAIETEIKMKTAQALAVDGQGNRIVLGKSQICLCQNGTTTMLESESDQWRSLLRDGRGDVYAVSYQRCCRVDTAAQQLTDCGYEPDAGWTSFSDAGTELLSYAPLNSGGNKDGVQLVYGGLIGTCDLKNGTNQPLFDTAGWTETGRLLHVTRTGDDACLCFIHDEETAALTVKQVRRTKQQKQLITVARAENNAFVNQTIAAFNRSSREYYAASRSYFGDQALLRLNMDINSGKAPDVISLHLFPYEAYAKQGILMDLQPLVEKTYADGELHTPALDAMRAADGKLYRIAPIYNIRALAVAEDIRPGERWSLEDMYAILEEYPEMTFFPGATGDAMLRTFLPPAMGTFIDEAAGTCSFDSPAFQRLLEQIREICARPQAEGAHLYQTHQALLLPIDLFSFRDYQSLVPAGMAPIGFPADEGTGVTLFSVVQFGICSATEKPDASWAFLQALLSETVQDGTDWLPLRTSSLEKLAGKAAEQLPGTVVSSYVDPEGAAAGTNMEMVTRETGTVEAMTAEQIEDVWWLLNHIDGVAVSAVSDEIMAIVREEAAACLLGGRSAEDVAAIIQNRVSTFLAETRQ